MRRVKTFHPQVSILDDDIFEEDEHFFVRLQKLRLEEGANEGTGNPSKGRLVEPLTATITILDDDHAGIFTFGQRVLRVSESTGMLTVTVVRNSGSRGTVAVPYHTEDGGAKAGVDYEETGGELEFTNEQTRWGSDCRCERRSQSLMDVFPQRVNLFFSDCDWLCVRYGYIIWLLNIQ